MATQQPHEEQLLGSVADIALLLLESGAETYRVEDSIQRIFCAYGIRNCQAFVIPSLILISFVDEEGVSHSRIQRLLARPANLSRVGAVNDLCRRICRDRPPVEEIRQELERCRRLPVWPLWVRALACILVGGSFTVIFGGGWADGVNAGLCSLGIFGARHMMLRLRTNTFFVHLASSSVAMVGALALLSLGLGHSLDLIVIGALMNLVPGLTITSFMRDIIAGDLVSGLVQLTEALLIATAIALGSGFTLTLLRPLLGG